LKAVPTDPEDDMVVACALEGGADYLVTAIVIGGSPTATAETRRS
jgi:hypothetical protein